MGSSVVFVIREWTWHKVAMPGCAENVVNTMDCIVFPNSGKFKFGRFMATLRLFSHVLGIQERG